jgi:hypothetical protein
VLWLVNTSSNVNSITRISPRCSNTSCNTPAYMNGYYKPKVTKQHSCENLARNFIQLWKKEIYFVPDTTNYYTWLSKECQKIKSQSLSLEAIFNFTLNDLNLGTHLPCNPPFQDQARGSQLRYVCMKHYHAIQSESSSMLNKVDMQVKLCFALI